MEQTQRKDIPVMRTVIRANGVEVETNNLEDLRYVMAALGLAPKRTRTVTVPTVLPQRPAGASAAEMVQQAEVDVFAQGLTGTLKGLSIDELADALDRLEDEDEEEAAPLAPVHSIERILVPTTAYAALEVILQFPEGISTRGVTTLLGTTFSTAQGRIQTLKYMGLVERMKGHKLWVATAKARESKLVAS